MLKKIHAIASLTLCFSFCACYAQSTSPYSFDNTNAQNAKVPTNRIQSNDPSSPAATKQRDAIMEENEEDSTDTYAIPLDSSEFELQEELDRLERKGGRPR